MCLITDGSGGVTLPKRKLNRKPGRKSRGSNSGPAGCGYIYASEVNQCPCFRHKVKVTPQNSGGYDRTVRFELPNYGFIENWRNGDPSGCVMRTQGIRAVCPVCLFLDKRN